MWQIHSYTVNKIICKRNRGFVDVFKAMCMKVFYLMCFVAVWSSSCIVRYKTFCPFRAVGHSKQAIASGSLTATRSQIERCGRSTSVWIGIFISFSPPIFFSLELYYKKQLRWLLAPYIFKCFETDLAPETRICGLLFSVPVCKFRGRKAVLACRWFISAISHSLIIWKVRAWRSEVLSWRRKGKGVL